MAKVLMPLVPLLQKVLPGCDGLPGERAPGAAGWIQRFDRTGASRRARRRPVANAGGHPQLGAIGTLFGWVRDSLIPRSSRPRRRSFPAVQNAVATVSAAFRDHQGMVNLVVAVFKILASFTTTILIPVMTQIVSAILATLGPAFRLIGTLVDTVVVPAFKFLVNCLHERRRARSWTLRRGRSAGSPASARS
jgi:hypothetical protein